MTVPSSDRLELLARIERFEIDDRYAERVVAEYKRFVFLLVCSDQMLAPSEDVDQVWHLHMTYTRSYWDRMCGELLHVRQRAKANATQIRVGSRVTPILDEVLREMRRAADQA